jgi:RND family efflux transporter MFP subunit
MAEADLRPADLALDFCTIRSPIDGVVTELHARLGLPVDPALSLATIVDNSHLVARFRVPGWFATGSVAGAPVEMSLTMDPRATFPGSILRVGKQAGASTGDVDALALVANEGRLLPGLGCHVRVLLPPAPDCLVIPLAALSDRDGTAVVTVARDGQAHELTVDIGIVTEREAQVLRGLVEGDLVVVENGYGLPEGCPLEIRFRSP